MLIQSSIVRSRDPKYVSMLRSIDLFGGQREGLQLVDRCLPPSLLHKGRQCLYPIQTRFIDDEMRSMSQRRYLVPQDLDAVVIRPVVKDGAEEIDFSSHERLLFQKVVGHERYPSF